VTCKACGVVAAAAGRDWGPLAVVLSLILCKLVEALTEEAPTWLYLLLVLGVWLVVVSVYSAVQLRRPLITRK
jgi:hypothetical protein